MDIRGGNEEKIRVTTKNNLKPIRLGCSDESGRYSHANLCQRVCLPFHIDSLYLSLSHLCSLSCLTKNDAIYKKQDEVDYFSTRSTWRLNGKSV